MIVMKARGANTGNKQCDCVGWGWRGGEADARKQTVTSADRLLCMELVFFLFPFLLVLLWKGKCGDLAHERLPVRRPEDVEAVLVRDDHNTRDLGVPVELLRSLQAHVLEDELRRELGQLRVPGGHLSLLLRVTLNRDVPERHLVVVRRHGKEVLVRRRPLDAGHSAGEEVVALHGVRRSRVLHHHPEVPDAEAAVVVSGRQLVRLPLVLVPVEDVHVHAVLAGHPRELRVGRACVEHLARASRLGADEDVLLHTAPLDVLDRPRARRGRQLCRRNTTRLVERPAAHAALAVARGQDTPLEGRPPDAVPLDRVPFAAVGGGEEKGGCAPRLGAAGLGVLAHPLGGVVELLELVGEVVARDDAGLGPARNDGRLLRHDAHAVVRGGRDVLLLLDQRLEVAVGVVVFVVVVVVLDILVRVVVVVARAAQLRRLHHRQVVLLPRRRLRARREVRGQRVLCARRAVAVGDDVEREARPVHHQLVEHVVRGRVVRELRTLGHLVDAGPEDDAARRVRVGLGVVLVLGVAAGVDDFAVVLDVAEVVLELHLLRVRHLRVLLQRLLVVRTPLRGTRRARAAAARRRALPGHCVCFLVGFLFFDDQ
eukprot:Rhum_TRINITY_DN14117_c22_g1::Rhum_TRINITY_DN14117_c22_g1_i1::g.72209::m.72209